MNIFNNNIGPETTSVEYKEFTFYPNGINIDNDDAIELLNNNKWIFNKNVIDSIKNMILTYLPKYTSAYLNANINENCELYFGINDFGDLIGIPYQGYFDIKHLIDYVKSVYKNNIIFDGNIMDFINISFIKLEHNFNKQDHNFNKLEDNFIKLEHDFSKLEHDFNINPNLIKYNKILKIYNEKKRKYISNKLTWTKLSNRYNSKLCDLVNTPDTRYELIRYIECYSPRNPVIKLLKTNFVLEYNNMDIVNKYKNNINNIYHWLTEWKDKMLQFIKSIKPRFLFKIPNEYYPLHILMAVKKMIPYWIKYNDNINLFIIKFTFMQKQTLNIQYKNIYGEWSICKRTIVDGTPCCINY